VHHIIRHSIVLDYFNHAVVLLQSIRLVFFFTTLRVFFIVTLFEMTNLAVTLASTAAKHIWHALQASIEVDIQNQCSGFGLVSPVYFCDGAACDIPLDQNIASKSSMKTEFSADLSRSTFQGAIMYEVRAISTPLNETDADNTMTETSKNASISIQLLVAWKASRYHDPFIFAALLEHESIFTWNERRLRQLLLEEYYNRFKLLNYGEINTWLMQDGTVLKTTMGVMDKGQYKLQIAISEGVKDEYTTTPVYYELRS
jgi:hypothetical protein